MQLLASDDSADYYTCPPGIVSLLMLLIHLGSGLTYTENRFNNHTVYSFTGSWSWISVMVVMKALCLEQEFNPHLWHSGPLSHICSLMSPLYQCPPVYAAPCLRGQYRLLQYISWLSEGNFNHGCLVIFIPLLLTLQPRYNFKFNFFKSLVWLNQDLWLESNPEAWIRDYQSGRPHPVLTQLRGCLRLSQCVIWNYDCHIRSVIMSDDRGNKMVNHHDFTLSLNLYYSSIFKFVWLHFQGTICFININTNILHNKTSLAEGYSIWMM